MKIGEFYFKKYTSRLGQQIIQVRMKHPWEEGMWSLGVLFVEDGKPRKGVILRNHLSFGSRKGVSLQTFDDAFTKFLGTRMARTAGIKPPHRVKKGPPPEAAFQYLNKKARKPKGKESLEEYMEAEMMFEPYYN